MKLYDFLSKYAIKSGEYSHLAMGGGKWNIPLEKNDEFLMLYHVALKFTNLTLTFAEQKTPIYPFFVDLDFEEEQFPQLPNKFYQIIMEIYHNVINAVCDISNSIVVESIITMRKPWKIHFNYHNLYVNNQISLCIRQHVIDKLKLQYASLTQFDWGKILDKSIYNHNGLRMIGSVKRGDSREDCYKVVMGGFADDNTAKLDENPISLEMVRKLSIRLPNDCKIIGTKIAITTENIKKPLIIKKKDNFVQENITSEIKETINIIVDQNKHNFPDHNLELTKYRKCTAANCCHYFIDTNDFYCPFIDRDHKRLSAPIYLHITEKGMCLQCHDVDCHGLSYPKIPIPLFDEQKNIIFNIKNLTINNTINNNTINNSNLNESNLELDNNELLEFDNDYAQISIFNDDKMNKILVKSLNGTPYAVGEFLYELFKDNYRCDLSNQWWLYENHKWVRGNQAKIDIKSKMSTTLIEHYTKVRMQYKELRHSSIEDYSKKTRKIDNLIIKLQMTNCKNNILTECGEIFALKNPHFLDKLDENTHLIGFNNGVFDLSENNFRAGRPSDNLTMSVGYNFSPSFSAHNEELRNFLESIQPEETEREYLLTYLATSLIGTNPDELFHIFSGKTRNGKSKLRDVIRLTLGEYYDSISSNLLTDRRPPSTAPQADIMGLKGKRILIGSEPEKGKQINSGFMKFLTGNDPIKGRGLYERNEYEYKPQFKIALLCNDIPDMDDSDAAIWSRCRVINFPVTFVEDPNPNNVFENKIDKNLSEKIINWKQDFMLLLLQYYQKYRKDGLIPTTNILSFTDEYRAETDLHLKYLKERTISSPSEKVHTSTLYCDFKEWFSQQYPSTKIPSAKKFVSGIRIYYSIEKVKINQTSSFGIKGLQLKITEKLSAATSEEIDNAAKH